MVKATLEAELLLRDLASSGIRRFSTEFTKMSNSVSSGSNIGTRAISGLSKATSALAGAAVFGLTMALVDLVSGFNKSEEEAEKLKEEIDALSKSSGIAASSLERLAKGGIALGVEGADLISLFDSLRKSMKEAVIDPASKAALAFKFLKVSVEDAPGSLRDVEDVFNDFAKATNAYADNPKRIDFLMDIFGASAAKASTLLKLPVEQIKLLGAGINPDKFDQAKKALEEIFRTTNRSAESIAAGLGTEGLSGRFQVDKSALEEAARQFVEARNKAITSAVKSSKPSLPFIEQLVEEQKARDKAAKDAIDAEKKKNEDIEKLRKESSQRLIDAERGIQATLDSLRKIRSDAEIENLSPMDEAFLKYQRLKKEIQDLSLATGLSAENQAKLRMETELAQKSAADAFDRLSESQSKSKEETKEVSELGKELGNIFTTGVAQGVTNAFQSIINKTAETKDAILGFLRDIAAQISQAILFNTIKTGLNSLGAGTIFAAKGAVLQGGFKAFASGGMVDRPTLGLIGEGGTSEAVIPLPDNRNVPVKLLGGQGGGITINVAANDAKSFAQMLDDPSAQRMIEQKIRRMISTDVPYRRQVGEI